MAKTTINLGDLAKDRITGFKGLVVAKTTWFDVEQVEVVKREAFVMLKPTGGPCNDRACVKRNATR